MSLLSPRSTLALIAACGAITAALAAPAVAPAAEGQIIVKYASGADAQERAQAREAADVARDEALPLARTELVTPEASTSVGAAIAGLERSPDVVYAEPDRTRSISRVPSDPQASSEWGLAQISAATAWDTTTGDRSVTVGVIDSGIDAAHPDLAPNLWTNPGEIPGNNVDDDHDGYVDDVHGWDFVDGDATPADLNGHGTHVAGTIAANGGDAIGVAGVAWQAGIVPLRALDAGGSGSTSDLIDAIAYAERKGVQIVNLSFGGTGYVNAEYEALRAAKDVLFIAAAGNKGTDNDVTPSYPCAYDLPNVVCVAATTTSDALASFSNWGRTSVDLSAPGEGIVSTYPRALSPSGYAWLSGTSMATPHVTGAAALVASRQRGLTPWQLGQVLLQTVDPVPALQGKVSTGGRLDAAAAVAAAAPPAAEQPATPAETTTDPVIAPVPTPAPTPVPVAAPATPAPTSTPVRSAPAVDRSAPAIALTPTARLALKALLAGRLRLPTAVSEKATLRVELRLAGRTAKRLRLTRGTAAVRIASGRASAGRAGATWVTLRLTSRAKRALARVRSVKATLRATATDAAGNRRTRSRTVTLVR
jgi:subtilisin family serine protease